MLERLETLSKITIKQALNVYGALPLSVFERVGERGKNNYINITNLEAWVYDHRYCCT